MAPKLTLISAIGNVAHSYIPGSGCTVLLPMKKPTEQEQRKENKKDNPPQGIDPEPEEPEMEAALNDQDPGERQKENQNQQKDDPLAA